MSVAVDAVPETSSSAPTLTETGNSVTGDYSLTEIATTGYTFDQVVGVPPSGGSGTGNSYSLHETGSNVFTVHQTGSTVTGDYSQTTTSSDSFTLAETGRIASTGGDFDYSQTITATDTATQTQAGNDLTGQFQLQVTGTTSGTETMAGSDHGTPFSWPSTVSTSFAVTESGNYVDGSLSLSETGSDRYHLLEQFSNTSNVAGVASTSGAGVVGPGNVDYSPVGAPLSIGQGPAAPTGGGAYPGGQSPAAEQQDPFAQQGLELLHEYCFPEDADLLPASGAPLSIRHCGTGVALRGPVDSAADGPIGEGVVEERFKNGTKPLIRVHWGAGLTRVTPNHPWYVKEKGWVASSHLKPGDLVRAINEGAESWLPVERIEDRGESAEVYNVRVSGTHTYMVGNGTGWFAVVHNTSPGMENPYWEGYKALVYGFWVEGVYGSAKALVTGDAGRALGDRGVKIVETQTGQAFTGTGSEWARFGRGVAGDVVGINDAVESVSGYDISNLNELDAWERGQRGAGAVGKLAGTAAGGLSAASRFPTALPTVSRLARTAPGATAAANAATDSAEATAAATEPSVVAPRSLGPSAERLAEDARKARTYPYNNPPRTTPPAAPASVPVGEVGSYNIKIKWGIQEVEARPAGPGYWGKRTPQKDPAVNGYELKINPNNESYYLPHPEGGFVQFENVVGTTLQDGKLVQIAKSFYKPSTLGGEMQPIAEAKVLGEAQRQLQAAGAQGMQVEWLVSDKAAAAEWQSLFQAKGLNIKVTHLPE